MRFLLSFSTVASLSLLVVCTAAVGQETPVAPVQENAGQVAKPPKEKKICRKVDGVASRMSNRVCKTAAEWAAAEGRAPNTATDSPASHVN
ncbi:MAG: hypothetical protein ACOY45_14250 [Pseudomonadota bacterium]